MSLADADLGFVIDPNGNRSLRGGTFTNQVFSTLELNVDEVGQEIVVEDSRFVKCEVDPGRFVFWNGVVLRNVLFDNIKHGGGILIHSNTCVLDRVKINRKRRTSLLWIKPLDVDAHEEAGYRKWLQERAAAIDLALDISEFHGDVEVYGIPVEKTIVNPTEQIKLRLMDLGLDWESKGIKTDFWQMALNDIRDFAEHFQVPPHSIVRMPDAKDDEYEAAMSEVSTLRRLGIAVD